MLPCDFKMAVKVLHISRHILGFSKRVEDIHIAPIASSQYKVYYYDNPAAIDSSHRKDKQHKYVIHNN